MMRKIPLLLVLLMTFMSVCFTAQADANECSFALSDVSAGKGRLFEVNLTIKSQEKVASFLGDITFDSDALEYRDAKCAYDNSLVSVNQKEKGKITFVYLCEEGRSCESETKIITFKFKAKNTGNYGLPLGIRDAVDSSGNDLSPRVSKGSLALVTASSGKGKDKGVSGDADSVGTPDEPDNDLSLEGNFTKIESGTPNLYFIFSLVAAVVVAMIIVAYIFYRLGVARSEKSLSPDGKGSEGYEEKT